MVRETSIKTYQEIREEGFLSEKQDNVYHALRQLGEATDREIAEFLLAKDPNVVRPRRKELLDMNLIVDVGVRTCRVTGRSAHTWRVLEHTIPLAKKRYSQCPECGGTGKILCLEDL